ncbi:family 78 glycoside hydrolase catalytic domain [Cohnella sp.]|uniref:family 78 glycoside hydrolase catalytic domain n=1 Tax=Cohnella sp. TaxID=1883426 RepID=UPI003568069D
MLRVWNDVQKERCWHSQWIWDVRQPEEGGSMEHRLVYFRRSFHVAEGVKPRLAVDITADSRYRLFVNGRSVAVGPCKGDRHTQHYETVDVSSLLRPGDNVLAVQVLRYPALEPFISGAGGPISVWRSQSAGLLVEASLRDEHDAELEPLHSGPEWKVYRHRGYRYVPKPLIQWMGGVEEVDGTGAPQGWQNPGFNDDEWAQALPFAETKGDWGLLSPWNLVPRPIPFLYEEERTFVKVTRSEGIGPEQAEKLMAGATFQLAAGCKLALELDAGELTTGYLTVGVRGGRGSVIRMLCSECYEDPSSSAMRRIKGNRADANGKLMGEYDVYRVAGHADQRSIEVYEPFWFRTFRYVQLEIEAGEEPIELVSFTYQETGYPLEVKGEFRCSDEELNMIWELSVRTLKRCMHETYEDCPYYEQLQYAMDSRLMMLFTYYVSADDRLPRRTIADFYRSRQPSGLLQSRFPSVEPQIIPSFALYWVDMLAEHYEFFGDRELIAAYRPALIELMDWYDARLTDSGIVGVTSDRYWTYFDWVEAWPLGAPPESKDRPMYLLSLMYAASLRKAAWLLEETGWSDAAGEMLARADSMCGAVRRLAWSEERQLFRDLPDTEIYSQHTQIMAVLAGTVIGEEARQLMERTLREPIHLVTLPFSFLLFQALKKTGLHHQAFGLWDRWRVFTKQGLTTLPETEVNPRSDCHAWSAVPLAEFPASFLGVTPAEPGFKTISIEPWPGKLKWAKGSIPTVQGTVEVEWELEANDFQLRVKLPDGVSARVKLPDGTESTLQGAGRFQCRMES